MRPRPFLPLLILVGVIIFASLGCTGAKDDEADDTNIISGDGDGTPEGPTLAECNSRSDSVDTCDTFCRRRGQTCSNSCQIWSDIPVGGAGLIYNIRECGVPEDGLMLTDCGSRIGASEYQCCCEGEITGADVSGKAEGESCEAFWDCQSLSCGDTGCTACVALGGECGLGAPCCEGFCSRGLCLSDCADWVESCLTNRDCCSGSCVAGRCD